MKETCRVCGRQSLYSDHVGVVHTRCIAKPIDDPRQLLTTLSVDELFTIRENLESRYTILRAELDEINACVWRCDNEIARRRHV